MALTLRTPCDEAVVQAKPADAPCVRTAAKYVLAATILASSMVFIDSTVVNVALPVLQSELHASIAQTQWVVQAYSLFLSALILVGGSLGDEAGRRRIFLLGIFIFAITSALCGLAHNVDQLIVARAFQGVGSALMTPGSLSLISASFDGQRRGWAIGTWSSFISIAGAIGGPLGGWIVQHASWRWIFFVNIPFALVVVVLTYCFVPESRDSHSRGVDWLGALFATAGLAAIVFALTNATTATLRPATLVGCLVLGVILLTMFVFIEARARAPMLPLNLFRSKAFSIINVMTLFLYGALGAALFFLPFDLIQVQHYSPSATGLVLLPLVVLLFFLSPWSGALATKFGAKLPLIAGSVLSAVGLAAFAVPGIGGSYWTTFFPGLVMLGLGMGLAVAPLTTTVMESVDSDHVGVASGVNNAAARTASLLSVAILSLVVVAVFNAYLDRAVAGLSVPSQVVRELTQERVNLAATRPPANAAPELKPKIASAVAWSYIRGFRTAVLLCALGAVASGLCALFLPGSRKSKARKGSS